MVLNRLRKPIKMFLRMLSVKGAFQNFPWSPECKLRFRRGSDKTPAEGKGGALVMCLQGQPQRKLSAGHTAGC